MINVKKFFGKVIHKGEAQNMYYLDQLSDEIKWIHCNQMKRYLDKTYNLTPEQYYNLVCYGDKNFIERCLYCCEPKYNFTKLSHGYRGAFCCHSCARLYAIFHPDQYPDVADQVADFNQAGIDNPGWNLPWVLTKKARSQFLVKGSPDDECIFYLAWTISGYLKLGITGYGLESRIYMQLMNGGTNAFKTIHKVYTGTRIQVANLEALLKYKFNHTEYLDPSLLHQVISELKILIKSNLNDYPY